MGKLKKTKIHKITALLIALITICGIGLVPGNIQAQPLSSEQGEGMDEQASAFRSSAGFTDNASIGGIIATAIKMVLGFLGIVFVIIVIINGFKWMTAGGNEDKVKEAKNSLKNAIIGLIIIMAAYSVTYFVFDVLSVAGNGGTSGAPI